MNTYIPDKWVIVRFTEDGKSPYYKVLCEWGGGFAYGSSWRLSNPITGVAVDSSGRVKTVTIKTLSGSSYLLTDYLNMLGMTTSGVIKELKESNKYSLEVVPYQEIVLSEESESE